MNSSTGSGNPSALAAKLRSGGDLPAERASIFETVARELFVQDRIWVQQTDDGPYQPIDRAIEPERWLAAVYSNRVIVTQFDDGHTTWPDSGYRPTSSASMPSAVAGMLAELDVQPGHSVLEIGTGTGYNAALLAELVGQQGQVTTVEVDTAIGVRANKNLESAGYIRVDVRVQDAATVAVTGEFDRIIATAGIHIGHVPYWWVESTRADGVILAPMRADLASGPLVKFVVGKDGTALGKAVSMRVGFMEIRSHRVASLASEKFRWDDEIADRSSTEVSPFSILLYEAPRWAAAVAVPSCRYSLEKKVPERDHGIAWLNDPLTGSWASIVPGSNGQYIVRQFGPRRLWDETEAAYVWWKRKGEPPIESWEWRVTPDRQTIQLEAN
ncbi:methyltransferase domain-containing protein [Crossiella sp. CA198]|uniref:methyltransferase domain-containing protein n=1 Tax=Crossiella sp. CA198 TaxID=3455607 RepID=UPI003F8D80C0